MLARVTALEEDVAALATKTGTPAPAREAPSSKDELEALRRRLVSMESRLGNAERAAGREAAPVGGDARFDALFERLVTLEASETAATTRLAELEGVARASAARLAELSGAELAPKPSSSFDAIDTRLRALETREAVPDGLEERLARLERQSDAALATRVSAVEARLVSLVARFADIAARAGVPMSMPPPPPAPEGRAEADAVEARLQAFEAELANRVRAWVHDELAHAATEKRVASSASEDPAERLRAIKGIGPTFARRLADEGVTSAAALAAIDDEGAAALAERLGVGVARVRKWTAAAQATID